jgi:hypothetical protein
MAPVAYAYNPSYLGDWELENWGSRPAQESSLQDPISKIITAKWTGGVAQKVDHLLCKNEILT